MKRRLTIAAVIALLMITALAPAAFAGVKPVKAPVTVPQWVTDACAQIAEVGNQGRAQVSGIYSSAMMPAMAIIGRGQAQLAGMTDPVAGQAIVDGVEAQIESIADNAMTNALEIKSSTASNVRSIISSLRPQLRTLTCKVRIAANLALVKAKRLARVSVSEAAAAFDAALRPSLDALQAIVDNMVPPATP